MKCDVEKKKRFDLAVIRQSVATLFEPGQVVEVRMIDKKKKLTVAGWFDDHELLAKWVAKLSRDGFGGEGTYKFIKDQNIYWTVNPVHDALLARQPKNTVDFQDETTSDSNVLRRHWFPIDVDPVRPSGVSASDIEKGYAQNTATKVYEYLIGLGVPVDSLIKGDSGNGHHVDVRVDLPNDDESRELLKSCLKALALMFNDGLVDIDQKVFNAARVLKAYGSLAVKGVDTEDRPWRMSGLIQLPEKTVVCPKECLEKLAAAAGGKKASNSQKNETRRGPWTEETLQEYLDSTTWDASKPEYEKDRVKWTGTCISNPNHKDSAIILHADGWWSYGCFHSSCQVNHDSFKEYWEEEQGVRCETPRKPRVEEDDFADCGGLQISFDDVVTEAHPHEPAQVESKAGTEPQGKPIETEDDCAAIKLAIDEIMRMPTRDNPKTGEPGMPLREKHRVVCAKVYKHMLAHGKLYDCGNVATYLDGKTRELIQVIKGSTHFHRLLMRYGILPSDPICDALGQFLGARAVTDAKKTTIYTMSYYDRENHVLFVNEYNGNFLRISGKPEVTRHRNGDFDMLFSDGVEAQCDPLLADLDVLPVYLLGSSLQSQIICDDDGGGLLEKHILDTILYDEAQLGRENAQLILINAILALFLYERVPSYPYVFLFGSGAAMKTSLAVKVGKLVQGRRFRVRPAEDDVQALKDLAISLPFLVLDEANNVKKLQNALKSIGTGAMDSRRELYTTAKMRHTPYQARIWMTANTASLTNETIGSRMLIIDAAPRTEENPYRSEHYLEWSDELRNRIWTELIGKLTCAMYELAQADAKGEGDLRVSHRMSSFFVFGKSLARQAGYEGKFDAAMKAMEQRQQGAAVEGNDIVELVKKLPKSYADTPRKAVEWAEIFPKLVTDANKELQAKASRANWVAWQFTSEFHTLTRECGMKRHTDKHNNTTRYSFSKVDGIRRMDDMVDVD
jgi:hypothetical protein